MQKLNVLIICEYLGAGCGITSYVDKLTESLKDNCNFYVATIDQNPADLKNAKTIIFKDAKEIIKEVPLFCKKRHIDLIHLQHHSEFIVELKEKTRLPVVVTFHTGLEFHKDAKFYFKLVSDSADKIFCINNKIFKQLESIGIKKKKLVRIKNAATPQNLEKKVSSEPIILFAGRLLKKKGLFVLLKASKYLVGKIIIAGSGPEEIKIKRFAKKIHANNVVFYGLASEKFLNELYQKASVFVIPSIWEEPCPMVLFEAFSFGIPVVASKVGGIPEIIKNNKNGILVRPGSKEELASAVNKLLKNKEFAKRIGMGGYQSIVKTYSWGIVGKKVLRTYFSVI